MSENCSLALNRSVALIINIKENYVPQNSGVKLQTRAAHDLTKRELLPAFSFSLFFFSLLLQIPASPCRYAHVNVTFFFFLSSLSASSFISLEFAVHLHPYGCFRRLCVCVCMFTYSSPTRA